MFIPPPLTADLSIPLVLQHFLKDVLMRFESVPKLKELTFLPILIERQVT